MRKLILVRHSVPEKVLEIPAKFWHLSEEGKVRCKALAESLVSYLPAVIIASEESKALETAQLIAKYLGDLPCETAPNLHEHERTNLGYLSDKEFQETVANFFAQPAKLVMGEETARQAFERFANAIQTLLENHPGGNLIVVTHGTVISLFVAAHHQIDPFSFWQQLKMPDVVEVAMNDVR